MTVMTDQETHEFISRHNSKSSTGLRSCNRNIYYEHPEANCIYLPFPETPLSIPYFARVVAMIGPSDPVLFSGGLLWLTFWEIGAGKHVEAGWKTIEKMRLGYGEPRPLEAASGHWFRQDEEFDIAAFLAPCFVYGWDAYWVPSGGDKFVFISHDEYWCVVARTKDDYDQVLKDFKDLKAQPANEKISGRFCRRN